MARREPGPGRGAGQTLRDVTPALWLLQWSPVATNFVPWEATSSLHAHLEGCFEGAGPPCEALFGVSVFEQVQPIQCPGQICSGAWLDLSPGWEEGRG